MKTTLQKLMRCPAALMLGAIAALCALIAITVSTFSTVPIPVTDVDYSHIEEMVVGDEDAPVTIIEYASFTCSHCAQFSNEVYPQLHEDYVATGKVRFVTREIYTHKAGLWASMVARCAGPEAFEKISSEIFEKAGGWMRSKDLDVVKSTLRDIGVENGLSKKQADLCLQDDAKGRALVARSAGLAMDDKVKGTPSFVINGKKVPNQPYEGLKAEIDAALKDASK